METVELRDNLSLSLYRAKEKSTGQLSLIAYFNYDGGFLLFRRSFHNKCVGVLFSSLGKAIGAVRSCEQVGMLDDLFSGDKYLPSAASKKLLITLK